MNTEYLRTLIAVADTGSFSRAQEELYISKQAIMQQINLIEKEVGVQIFLRNTQGVTLTKAGQIFYQGAQAMIKAEKKLIQQRSAAGSTGILRLSNIDYHVLLDPVTSAYMQRYPAVDVQRIFHPVTLEAHLVQQEIIDVGDTLYHPRYTHGRLRYEKLLDMPYFCIFPSPVHASSIEPQALKDTPLLVDHREFSDYYSFHLDWLKELFPNLEVVSTRERRIEIIYQAIQAGKTVITASTFARQNPGLHICDLNVDFHQECGVVYREDAGREVLDYVALAKELYPEAT